MDNRHSVIEKIRSMFANTSSGLIIALFALALLLSIASKHFLTVSNISDVFKQSVFVAIISFGMTFVIAMAGIDLSVGSIFGICGAVVAFLLLTGVNVFVAILLSLVLGSGIGLLNGLLITKLGVTDFIVTLAMMGILRGVIMVFTHGMPIYGIESKSFDFFGQGSLIGIPVTVVITVLLFVLCHYLMYRTKFGRYIFAIGSNTEAARLVGININKMKILGYTLSGLLSALSGILLTSRLDAAMPSAGTGYELDVIAAVVIGGTSLYGGSGSLIGSALGAILMVIIQDGLNLLNVSTYWQQVVIGGVILIAVALDKLGWLKRKKKIITGVDSGTA